MESLLAPMIYMSNSFNDTTKIGISLAIFILSLILKNLNDHGRVYKLAVRFLDTLIAPKQKAYILKARISYKHNVIFDHQISHEFKAIQHKLYNKILDDKNTNIDYTIDEHNIDGITARFVCMDTKYEIEPGIMIKQHVATETNEKEGAYFTYMTYTFEISNKDKKAFGNVIEFIRCSVKEHENYQVMQLDQKIWVLDGFYKNRPDFTSIEFISTKTFENMFFEAKDTLRQTIANFEDSVEMYRRLGIPHTLGLFFYGRHGTGKTSCAKSIAAYTGRQIVLASLAKVKTARQFANLFLDEYINGIRIPVKNRLYVFDDFDCNSWKDVVAVRGAATATKGGKGTSAAAAASDIAKLAHAIAGKKRHHGHGHDNYEEDDSNDLPITLGDFLEILDGFVEPEGRMIIFISNFINDIDPAIIRPGRVDAMIEFKNMRRTDVADMYRLWFDREIQPAVYAKMRDHAYSQAEIGNLFKTRDVAAIDRAFSS